MKDWRPPLAAHGLLFVVSSLYMFTASDAQHEQNPLLWGLAFSFFATTVYGLLLTLFEACVEPLLFRRIKAPPGCWLSRFAEFVFSKRTVELVIAPTLADLEDEYQEALSEGRTAKAQWVRLRGYWSFWSAVAAQMPLSLARRVYELWKAAG